MAKKTENTFPVVTEGYFGSYVEVLCLIEELNLYLVRVEGNFHTYDSFGTDPMNLSFLDTDEFKEKTKKVKLKDLDAFVKTL